MLALKITVYISVDMEANQRDFEDLKFQVLKIFVQIFLSEAAIILAAYSLNLFRMPQV